MGTLCLFWNLEMITVTDSQMTADVTGTSHYRETILQKF